MTVLPQIQCDSSLTSKILRIERQLGHLIPRFEAAVACCIIAVLDYDSWPKKKNYHNLEVGNQKELHNLNLAKQWLYRDRH